MSTDAATAPAPPGGPAARPVGGIWAPARRPLTVGLVLAVTFVAFEALAIATVLPVVGRHLGDLRLYGWVFSAFLLASLIGIVLAGTLADRVPLWRPMLAAAALGIGRGPGVALAFSFGIVVALTGVIVGAQLPGQLTGSTVGHPR